MPTQKIPRSRQKKTCGTKKWEQWGHRIQDKTHTNQLQGVS